MASAAIKVTAYGVNGKLLPSPQDIVVSSLYAVVLETTQDVAGASCTVRAVQGPAGNIFVNYNVSQTMTQVLDLLNADTTSDLTVVNNLTVEGNIIDSVETSITAHAGGGQASAYALTKDYNIVTTVATAADSVKLPTAVAGLIITVKNTAANALDVYPYTGDAINGGSADASISVPANCTVTFVANSTSNWETEQEALAPTNIYTDYISEKTSGQGITMQKPIIRLAGTAKAVNTTGSISAAELAGALITSTSAAGVTATLPTATLLATQLGATRGTSFEFIVDNSLGSNTVTVAVNTGITVGTAAVTGGDTLTVSTANVIGVFRLTFTSTTTAILRRIC